MLVLPYKTQLLIEREIEPRPTVDMTETGPTAPLDPGPIEMGRILAVGSDVSDALVEQRLMFNDSKTHTVTYASNEYLFIDASDVLALIDDSE